MDTHMLLSLLIGIVFFVLYLALFWIVWRVARKKNQSQIKWIFYSIFISPLLVTIILLASYPPFEKGERWKI